MSARGRSIHADESGEWAATLDPAPTPPPAAPIARSREQYTLLLVAHNPDDAIAIAALLNAPATPATRVRIRQARNLTEAQRLLNDDVNCILLDLDLPGGAELDALQQVLRLAPRTAVVVLTEAADARRGAEAVRVGAQDYLVRGELDGSLLTRAIRYAIERKRADISQRQLDESRLRAEENARLERGLLPTPLLDETGPRFASRYRPGRSRSLLGGDFYDTVQTPDGTVHAMIGDVCGHGPDEAALGVELRIAWRALTFAGLTGQTLLSTLEQVLVNERPSEEIFATLCLVDIAPGGQGCAVYLAGHPSPLLARSGCAPELLPGDLAGPALGLPGPGHWPRREVQLHQAWSLMLYTDGLIEGRVGEGSHRLGQEGITQIVGRLRATGLRGQGLLDETVTHVQQLNGGELTDDVAVVLLERLDTPGE